jgi:hypothetical protein
MTNDKLSELPHLDKIVQSVIAMCRGYANAGVDGIIVNEANMNLQIEDIQSLTGIYKPIFNVISYFNLLSVLLNPQQSEKTLPLYSVIGANAGILLSDVPPGSKGSIGIPLSKTFWSEDTDDIQLVKNFITVYKNKGIFLTTEAPINKEEIDLFELQDKIEKITSESYWKIR